MTEMCRLLTTHRIASGWHPEERSDLEIRARVYIDRLNLCNAPASAYMDLYRRFSEMRSKAIRDGAKPPELSADALASVWDGPNGLRADLAAKGDPAQVEGTACPMCGGSGFKPADTPDARYPGVQRCSH